MHKRSLLVAILPQPISLWLFLQSSLMLNS